MELIGDSSSAFIYAYSADADTRELGSVFYRESRDEELLDLSTNFQGLTFSESSQNFTSLFIATWFYVGYYDGGTDRVMHETVELASLHARGDGYNPSFLQDCRKHF